MGSPSMPCRHTLCTSVHPAQDVTDSAVVGEPVASNRHPLPDELRELEADAHTRLSPVLDRVADDWKQQHGNLSELEKIDRELTESCAGASPAGGTRWTPRSSAKAMAIATGTATAHRVPRPVPL